MARRPRSGFRSGARGLALASALLFGFASARSSGADQAGQAFDAIAEASGGYVQYGIANFLAVENYLDGGGPVSQSTFSSAGSSQAFASLPYPGSTAVSGPGLVTGLTGLPVPAYPFYAGASHPTQPQQEVTDPSGGYLLRAKADDRGSRGFALAGSASPARPGPRAEAGAEVATDGGVVTVTAGSLNQAVQFGPLSITSVRSTSVTKYDPSSADPVTTTAFTVEGGRVGDLAFSFGSDGLRVAQQAIPLPVSAGLDALNQALAPAGMSIRFEAPTPIKGGAMAGVVEMSSDAPVPGAGTGRFRLRLGGAMSAVVLGGAALPIDLPATVGSPPEALPPAVPGEAADRPQASSAADSGSSTGAGIAVASPLSGQDSRSRITAEPFGSGGPVVADTAPALTASPAGDAPAGSLRHAVGEPIAAAEPIVSPRDFDASTRLVLLLIAGSGMALALLAGWARIRRLQQWTV
ncbi:MAG TPA: hypothetical protein VHL53_00700 [Acidimicrobiia bacterium]|nr:hypothetical protein [Acidimicrobiia bacterium]